MVTPLPVRMKKSAAANPAAGEDEGGRGPETLKPASARNPLTSRPSREKWKNCSTGSVARATARSICIQDINAPGRRQATIPPKGRRASVQSVFPVRCRSRCGRSALPGPRETSWEGLRSPGPAPTPAEDRIGYVTSNSSRNSGTTEAGFSSVVTPANSTARSLYRAYRRTRSECFAAGGAPGHPEVHQHDPAFLFR